MKIYLAARWSRGKEMRNFARRLREERHVVVSTWHDDTDIFDENTDTTWPEKAQREFARHDLLCIRNADCMVLFTDKPGTCTRSGHHVESGVAIGMGMPLIVVGQHENVFHAAGGGVISATEDGCIKLLREAQERIYGRLVLTSPFPPRYTDLADLVNEINATQDGASVLSEAGGANA